MKETEPSNRRKDVDHTAFVTDGAVLGVTQIALGLALWQGWMWLVIPLVLVASHFMHGMLIGFHEASHGLLRRNRSLNEIDGVLIGIFSLTSFSLYRASHQTHHAFLGTERDEELWPFVHPEMPRAVRVGSAFLELFFGLFFTPFLFVRTFLRKDSPLRKPSLRRRIWIELLGMAAFWIVVLAVVAYLGIWNYFFWLYFVPAWIAGNLQSWRKYIEHVGMLGDTVNSATRSIVPKTQLGRILAFTLLHEPYHGVHHQHSGLPHVKLPSHADELEPQAANELPPFPSYWQALLHLVQCLADPKVGAQWLKKREERPAEAVPAA